MIEETTNTIASFEFEEYFIIGTVLTVFLVIYNLLHIVKFIYFLITRKKASQKHTSNTQRGVYNTNNFEKFSSSAGKFKSGIKKIGNTAKKVFVRIFRPFNFLWYRNYLLSKKKLKVLGRRIVIPNLATQIIKFVLVNAVVLLFVGLISNKYFFSYPQYTSVYPHEGAVWDDYKKPITITFDVPINKNALVINMNPEEQQEKWQFEKSFPFLPFTRTIKYYPKETVYPNEKIMVYFTDLTNHFQNVDGGEHLLEYKSISLPEIVSTSPADGQIDVSPETKIELNLNQDDGDYIEWNFEFDKQVPYTLERNSSNKLSLIPDKKLSQGKDYTVKVYQVPIATNIQTGEVTRKGEKKEVGKIKFTTVKAPFVDKFEPEGSHVLPSSKIKVVFDNKMNRSSVEKAFSVEPKIEGAVSWENDRTFIFTPASPLPKETHFKAKFSKGIKSALGGFVEEDIVFEFDTIGRVKVVGWLPGYSGGNVSVGTNIHVTFDQQVDHSSAQNKFSTSPSLLGSFSWNGNTMIFNPASNLGYQTTYTINIASGVKTVHGLDSSQNFSSHFTTESQVFTLNVPQYYQTHSFTCNVTAAAMALSYKGAGSSEMGVYNGINKDSTACTKDGNGNITYWGNPNVGYVGNIDGGGSCGGYGVHWGPIAGYINSRGRSAQIISGWSAAQVAQEVQKGNPIIVWGQNGWASATWKSWNSPTGQVNALNGMHSEVVVGFIGSANNPSHILTNDPWRGRRTLTVSQFYGIWGYFGRRGVLVK